jgi:hypothetical protein
MWLLGRIAGVGLTGTASGIPMGLTGTASGIPMGLTCTWTDGAGSPRGRGPRASVGRCSDPNTAKIRTLPKSEHCQNPNTAKIRTLFGKWSFVGRSSTIAPVKNSTGALQNVSPTFILERSGRCHPDSLRSASRKFRDAYIVLISRLTGTSYDARRAWYVYFRCVFRYISLHLKCVHLNSFTLECICG